MANFTDPLLSYKDFTPYVQQNPVEAMVAVGTQKQQQYNEGVQKIQSQIENIAGIEVVNDVDKQYLNSKLNELGSRLKGVAAGDFSNFQLVNSVGGMVSQVGKDKNIQNAYASTIRYRKESEKMQKDIDEGKSNPANVYNFNRYSSAYLSSTKPGESFNALYSPNFDVDKFTREAFDAVKPDNVTFEQLYQTGEDGKPLKDKQGKYILSPVMTKLKREGRFSEKVRQTLDQIFSDPRVSQQISINGEYNYRGYDSNMLKEKLINTKQNQLNSLDNLEKELLLKKTTGQNVDKEMDDLTTNKDRITNQFDELLQATDKNPDAIRAMIHKDEVLDNYKSMYSTLTEERTNHENPAWNANFKLTQESNRVKEHADDLRFKYANALKEDGRFYAKLNYDIKNELLKGLTDVPSFGPNPSNIDYSELATKRYDAAALFHSTNQDALIFATVLKNDKNESIIKGLMQANLDLDREDAITIMINNTAKAKGEPPAEFRARWLNKALDQISQNKETTDPIVVDLKDAVEKSQIKLREETSKKEKLDNLAPNPLKGIGNNLQDMEVEGLKLSKQDQLDIAYVYNKPNGLKSQVDEARARLESKGIHEGFIQKIVQTYGKSKDDPRPQFGAIYGTPFTGERIELKDPSFKQLVKRLGDIDFPDNVKKRGEVAKTIYQYNPALLKPILTGTDGENEIIKNKLISYLNNYVVAEKNLSPDVNKNAPEMMEVLTNKVDGSLTMKSSKDEITGEVTPVVVVIGKDGKTVGEFTVSKDEALSVKQDVDTWYELPETKQAKELMNFAGNNTTSEASVTDPYTYRMGSVTMTKDDFPNLKNIEGVDVKSNITFSGGRYYGHLYVNGKLDSQDKNVEFVKNLEVSKPTMDEIIQLMKGIDSLYIQKIISENKK